MNERYRDLIIVGGGLAGGLLAYRLRCLHPDMRLLLVEREERLGGNHTWSFHSTDVSEEAMDWLAPFVVRSWPGHTVHFPTFTRWMPGGYHSVTSARFHEILSRTLGEDSLRLGTPARVRDFRSVEWEGRTWEAGCVVDARGARGSWRPGEAGFQKFVGWDVRLQRPHGLDHPVLMDALCEQKEGFRFFYVLPWSPRRALIEDTRYSDTPEVDVPAFRREIEAYAARRGWRIDEVEREEVGSLPIPLYLRARRQTHGVPAVGMRGEFFQPTTGYSFPETVGLVETLSRVGDWEPSRIRETLLEYGHRTQTNRRYFRLLNRMLFLGAAPEQRRRVFERFYGLGEGLIGRFYRGELTGWDRARILMGKPPIPVRSALRCLSERPPRRRGESLTAEGTLS